jgi:hypothetical protein
MEKNLHRVLFAFFCASSLSAKGREPCSGKKGGISHCESSRYVCNDGSKSNSKKHCSIDNDVKKFEKKPSNKNAVR